MCEIALMYNHPLATNSEPEEDMMPHLPDPPLFHGKAVYSTTQVNFRTRKQLSKTLQCSLTHREVGYGRTNCTGTLMMSQHIFYT